MQDSPSESTLVKQTAESKTTVKNMCCDIAIQESMIALTPINAQKRHFHSWRLFSTIISCSCMLVSVQKPHPDSALEILLVWVGSALYVRWWSIARHTNVIILWYCTIPIVGAYKRIDLVANTYLSWYCALIILDSVIKNDDGLEC